MPKPRVLEKYDVDESRCILCGICVDACPYDALRCGPDNELSHTSRADPMIDLIALAAIDRETEMTYVRRERDWFTRAVADGRIIDPAKMLPVLPPSISEALGGDGHGNGHGNGHGGIGPQANARGGHTGDEVGPMPDRSQEYRP
jgi:ferredoxin